MRRPGFWDSISQCVSIKHTPEQPISICWAHLQTSWHADRRVAYMAANMHMDSWRRCFSGTLGAVAMSKLCWAKSREAVLSGGSIEIERDRGSVTVHDRAPPGYLFMTNSSRCYQELVVYIYIYIYIKNQTLNVCIVNLSTLLILTHWVGAWTSIERSFPGLAPKCQAPGAWTARPAARIDIMGFPILPVSNESCERRRAWDHRDLWAVTWDRRWSTDPWSSNGHEGLPVV